METWDLRVIPRQSTKRRLQGANLQLLFLRLTRLVSLLRIILAQLSNEILVEILV